MSFKRNYPNSCSLFRKRSLKKVKANFHVDFATFLQHTFSLVEFSQLCDWMLRQTIFNQIKKNFTTMLVISISTDDLWLHQKIEENFNGRAIFVIMVVERLPSFIAFMTGKMFWLQISFKIGRFEPGSQRSKSRSIFWIENQRILELFSLSSFSTQMF